MTSTIKVNNIQNQCGANIANKCGSTITLGASGDTITLACGASQTGFGRTGTVDWDTTAKTASFTAVSGTGYFVNTTSGAITVTLPAGSAGDIVSLADYAATWQTNNVTVTPNGTDKIGGQNESAGLSTEGQSVTFVYTDSTKGWINTMDSTSNVRGGVFISATGGTVTTCGDYKIHTFTSPGTFCVSAASGPLAIVDYLVVAGGGGGAGDRGSGGGGGGFRLSNSTCMPAPLTSPLATSTGLPVTVTGYPITVGAGGSAGLCTGPKEGSNGSNSVFSTIISAGGGFGGGGCAPGNPGGSGGGGREGNSCGGTGNTPPVSPPQGNPGGCGVTPPGSNGGGGGAGAAGVPGTPPSISGAGGDGSYVLSAGFAGCNGTTGPVSSARYFAGGGGSGSSNPAPGESAGGAGGGGDGKRNGSGDAGVVNTGGAGGGAGETALPCGRCGGAGGSGIVIIRYKYQ